MYAMVVFGGGDRCPGSKCRVTRDDSNSCSRPTVLGHARCLRYWQPAKVHKAAGAMELYRIVPADSLPRPPPPVM